MACAYFKGKSSFIPGNWMSLARDSKGVPLHTKGKTKIRQVAKLLWMLQMCQSSHAESFES